MDHSKKSLAGARLTNRQRKSRTNDAFLRLAQPVSENKDARQIAASGMALQTPTQGAAAIWQQLTGPPSGGQGLPARSDSPWRRAGE
jgi:hypothetical protein